VAPADAQGKDGRHWFELELDPGQTVTEHLAVKNLSSHAVTFGLAAADGYFNKNGRYGMLADPAQSVDAGLWVKVQPAVEVAAGETVIVPFTVTVPANAEPGDHPAGIAASASTGATSGGGSGMGVTSRVGVRVLTRVTGEVRPSLEIQNTKASYRMSWSPLEPGELVASFDLVNTGNIRLDVTGLVKAGSGEAVWPADDDQAIELLPGGTRHLETTVSHVWPWFYVTATVQADPQAVVVASDNMPPALAPVNARIGVIALPIPQIFVLSGLVLIVVLLIAARRKSKQRVQGMIDQAVLQAKAETRRELAKSEQVEPVTRRKLRENRDGGKS
jgi:hypothetical protein